jgi:hypothetical protein
LGAFGFGLSLNDRLAPGLGGTFEKPQKNGALLAVGGCGGKYLIIQSRIHILIQLSI